MIKILMFVLCFTVLITLMNQYQKTFVIPLTIAASTVFFFYILHMLQTVISKVRQLAASVGLNILYVEILLKIIGIAYLCEFASAVCKDSGQSAFSVKIDLAGKLMILSSAIPVFFELLDVVSDMLPG